MNTLPHSILEVDQSSKNRARRRKQRVLETEASEGLMEKAVKPRPAKGEEEPGSWGEGACRDHEAGAGLSCPESARQAR